MEHSQKFKILTEQKQADPFTDTKQPDPFTDTKQPDPFVNQNTKSKTSSVSFKSCNKGYHEGCKSETIRKVQGCLNTLVPATENKLTEDGKFGPLTLGVLDKEFPELNGVFRDSEVEKICSKKKPTTTTSSTTNQTTTTQSTTGVSGEVDFINVDDLIGQ